MTTNAIQATNSNSFKSAPPSVASREAHQKAVGVDFNELLNKALTEPGIISRAYSRFHRFSLSNQLLAAMQLEERGMSLAPVASFARWQELGRQVKNGEKALALFMPLSIKAKSKDVLEEAEDTEASKTFTHFAFKRHWFSLDQTDGADYAEPLVLPAWNAEQALTQLDVQERRFEMVNGNVQGYALDRTIAVNPLAALPHKTRFHELAHVVLGHTEKTGCWDTASLPRHIEEAEAEGVAFILCALLGLPGLAESRGYIQSWLDGETLPEKSARRIFLAAQDILAAGKSE
jgi:hypothetical protein